MKLRNKLLISLLATYLALIPVNSKAQLGRYAKLLPQEYSEIKDEKTYRTRYKNNNYSGTLVYGPKSAWFVYNTSKQELIGDQEEEKEDYSNLALTFEIERFDSLNPKFPSSLRKLSENLRIGLIQYETTYKIPMFIIEEGSRLEGILIGAIHTGGANLPTQVQTEFIKQITNQESENFKNKFLKSIKLKEEDLKDPNKIIEVTEVLKSYIENTLEFRVVDSREKLEKSAKLFEKYNNNWTYEPANECFNNLIEGHIMGRASLRLMNDLEKNVDWILISKKIASHFAEGYSGVPAEEIFEIPEIKQILDKYNFYIEEELKLFMPMISRFDLNDPESAASLYLNSDWTQPVQQNKSSAQTIYDLINACQKKDINLLKKDARFNDSESLIVDSPFFYLNKYPEKSNEIINAFSKMYSCNKMKLSQLLSSNGYEIFYLKPESQICDDGLNEDFEYRGELFYLKKENNSWNIKEIVNLSKQSLKNRAKQRLSNFVISITSEYAAKGGWPKFVLHEPKIIPDFNKNPTGSECSIGEPIYEKFPSRNKCFFSYNIKNTKINPNDIYIIEAAGNLDSDPDLEIIQIGVPSSKVRYVKED